jgi:hypothetical protein
MNVPFDPTVVPWDHLDPGDTRLAARAAARKRVFVFATEDCDDTDLTWQWMRGKGEACLFMTAAEPELFRDEADELRDRHAVIVLSGGLPPDLTKSMVRDLSARIGSVAGRVSVCPFTGDSPDYAERWAQPVADWLASGTKTAQKAAHQFINADDLMRKTFPPMKWIVPGFLPEGCTIFAGKPKVGKSWAMLDWALAVGSGDNAFGGIECERGDALYLALEDNERRLQSRLRKLKAGEGLRLTFLTEAPRLGEGLEDLIRDWAAGIERPRLVILDTLAMVRPATKASDRGYSDDYGAVAKCRDLAAELGIAVVIVHHTRKMAGEDPFDDVSGTLGLSGAADASAIIRRDGAGTTLYVRGRDIEEAEHALSFDRETCRFSVLGAAADVRRSDERRAILDAIDEAGEPMSPTQIADALGILRNNVKQLLFKMVRAGEVAKAGPGKYGLPSQVDDPEITDNLDNPITGDGGDHE